jgi:hypothetical protein
VNKTRHRGLSLRPELGKLFLLFGSEHFHIFSQRRSDCYKNVEKSKCGPLYEQSPDAQPRPLLSQRIVTIAGFLYR